MLEHYGTAHPLSRNPNGWFAVALSHELAAGDVKAVSCLGHDLVLFRTENGKAGLLDAYCPHVGAHLGHGGCVEGEALRCPFHRWAFDVNGLCLDIPYSARRNTPKARTRHWPVVERNGAILAWFHAGGEKPTWHIPALPSEHWSSTAWLELDYTLHIQDLAENGIDTAHFYCVHGSNRASAELLQTESVPFHHILKTAYPGEGIGLPGQYVKISTEWKYFGLGVLIGISTAEDFGTEIRQLFHFTPIPGDRVLLRIGFAANRTTMPDDMIEVVQDTNRQMTADHFEQDRAIWKYKRHVLRPMLSDGDGPFGPFRRWTRQFYPLPTPSDLPVANDGALSLEVELSPEPASPTTAADVFGGGKPVLPTSNGQGITLPTRVDEGNGASANGILAATEAIRATFFEQLPATFDPAAAAGREFVIQYELAGDFGGKYFVEVRNGACSPSVGEHPAPTVRVAADASDWLKINSGALSRTRAFLTGRLRVKGDMSLAMKLGNIFRN